MQQGFSHAAQIYSRLIGELAHAVHVELVGNLIRDMEKVCTPRHVTRCRRSLNYCSRTCMHVHRPLLEIIQHVTWRVSAAPVVCPVRYGRNCARLEQPEDLAGAAVGLKLAPRERHGPVRVEGQHGLIVEAPRVLHAVNKMSPCRVLWSEPELSVLGFISESFITTSAMVFPTCSRRSISRNTGQVFCEACDS